ncbi:hypothetical protein [Metabacillus halosaccharovorans]|uniref:Uncharacterized protein n=1 Tax=Metabacillus halosaccharovorans TaxID=930124 RepID=A0ABT3DCF3_9BACI|nr:hypothetical protein [Metabacillus halosaccharovorans]MCV9884725.1 hypothetical protein [Metabacillus halosaccharovorans]
MKVRTLVAVPSRIGHIQPGWEFEADLVDQFYVVKDGFFSGSKIHRCACEVVKVSYSEKEWNDMENHYLKEIDKEREEKKILMLEFERKLINFQLANEEARSQIRKWYLGALIREEDKTDPDGYAKEAIEEVVHYLGGDKILADISPFCRNQLSKK